MKRCFLLVALCWTVAPALGQTISTDRPDFGAGTAVVPVGTFQLEAGVKRARDGAADSDQVLESLLRFGLAGPVELRASWAGWQRFSDENVAFSGVGDLSFGTKLALHPGEDIMPATSVVATLTIPSGDDSFSAGTEIPELRVALAWAIRSAWGLTLNVGAFWVEDGVFGAQDGKKSNEFYSVTLGRAGEGGHSTYLELFGIFAPDSDANQHSLGVGYLYLIHEQLQLDLYVGSGLSEAAPKAFIGAGVALRLPR